MLRLASFFEKSRGSCLNVDVVVVSDQGFNSVFFNAMKLTFGRTTLISYDAVVFTIDDAPEKAKAREVCFFRL